MKRREKEIKRVLKRLNGYAKEIKEGICKDILCYIVSRTFEVEIRTRISNIVGFYVPPEDDQMFTVAALSPEGQLLLARPENLESTYNPDELTPEDVIRLSFMVPQIFNILSDETLFDIKFLSESARNFCDSLVSSEFITKVKHIEPFISSEDSFKVSPPFRGAHITKFVPINTFVFQKGLNYCDGVPKYGYGPRESLNSNILIAGEMVWSRTEYLVKCWNSVNGEKRQAEYKLTLGFPGLFSGYENFNKG